MSSLSDRIELLGFPDELSLADAAAARWLDELKSAATSSFSVALAGGRVARHFCASATRIFRESGSSIDRVHFFWGDERCVPPTHPESNFRMAQEHLLSPLAVESDRVHRICGERNEVLAASEAEAEIRRWVPASREQQPVLDLILLGMGEDGHVASLFPNEPEASMLNAAVYRSVVATKPPPARITLGYPAIAAAREVWVLASGPGKEEALRASLAPEGNTPLARVIRMRQRTVIFSDVRILNTSPG